jgi:hypothetical protein
MGGVALEAAAAAAVVHAVARLALGAHVVATRKYDRLEGVRLGR